MNRSLTILAAILCSAQLTACSKPRDVSGVYRATFQGENGIVLEEKYDLRSDGTGVFEQEMVLPNLGRGMFVGVGQGNWLTEGDKVMFKEHKKTVSVPNEPDETRPSSFTTELTVESNGDLVRSPKEGSSNPPERFLKQR